jgi:hypothetical protein
MASSIACCSGVAIVTVGSAMVMGATFMPKMPVFMAGSPQAGPFPIDIS